MGERNSILYTIGLDHKKQEKDNAMKLTYEKAGERLEQAANMVVKVFGCGIFFFLIWYNMRYTQHTLIGKDEKMINEADSVLWNLLAAAAVMLLVYGLFVLERRLSEKARRRITLAAVVLAMIWIGCLSCWWIIGADRVPWEDQAYVYGGASYVMEGQYAFFQQGGYFQMYPYQLGLVWLMELLFRAAGPYNYQAYEILCGFMAPLIVYFGYKVTEGILDRFSAKILYCLLISCCLPLVFYTSWVYGEVPFILAALLSLWLLLRYLREHKARYLAGMVLSLTIALMVRSNAMVLVAALCLVMGVHAVRRKDWRILIAGLLIILVPNLTMAGIQKMYEIRTGYELGSGQPKLGWISMGMQESNWGYGWYSYYPTTIFNEAGYDPLAAKEIAMEDIRERLDVFRSDPAYAWTFYREKILSQWNDPLYQSIQFNTQFSDYMKPKQDTLLWKLCYTDYFTKTLNFCDRLQFVIYLGCLLYFLMAVRRRSDILEHGLAVSVIGCFLLSIIWEAKARYIFTCYVTLFPLAAAGYCRFLQQVRTSILRRTLPRRKQKEHVC